MSQQRELKFVASVLGGTILIASLIDVVGIIPPEQMINNQLINILVAIFSFLMTSLISYWAIRKERKLIRENEPRT